jgi:hypothetical protein
MKHDRQALSAMDGEPELSRPAFRSLSVAEKGVKEAAECAVGVTTVRAGVARRLN